MAHWGQAELVGLGHMPEAGAKSFRAQVAEGIRRDTLAGRLNYLTRVNYAHNYMKLVRRRSNDPAYLARAGSIERRMFDPLARQTPTARAARFHADDYHVEPAMLPVDLVAGLRDDLFAEPRFYDPYAPDLDLRGAPASIRHPMLYMPSERLFSNANFLSICACQDLIDFCREALGPAAALSWAWAWISNPGFNEYQNQNWHRDSNEPLNFVRVFVPLTDIRDELDGPTVLIPGSARHPDFFEVRRYSDRELSVLQARNGAGMILADTGDVYFVNTFALHRGTAPMRRRAILTLLVSLAPSHRTATIARLRLRDVPEPAREAVRANRRFFRHLVE